MCCTVRRTPPFTVKIMHVLNTTQTLNVLLYRIISGAFIHQFPLVTTGWECDTEDTYWGCSGFDQDQQRLS